MTPVRPSGAPRGPMTPWLVIGGLGGGLGLLWLVWLSGRIAAVVTGHRWSTGPAFGRDFIGDLLAGHTATLWPGVPVPLVIGVAVAFLALITVTATVLWLKVAARRPAAGDPIAALASPTEVAPLTPAGVTAKAVRLRPDLADRSVKDLTPEDTGLLLGKMMRSRINLRACWEDVLLVFMGPRTGKTTSLAIPMVLDAPGTVVATSNRADLLLASHAIRAAIPDATTWVFDPQQVAFTIPSWWWNPLDGIDTVEDAERLASHFVLTVDDPSRRDIWGPGAAELLSALILAASIGKKSIAEVYRWLTDDTPEPVDILRTRPDLLGVADGLRGMQTLAWETKTGIYGTARIGARCLRNPQIMAWVNRPRRGVLPQFDPRAFARSAHDTLYLLSKEAGGSAAPLVAALTDRVIREATRYAETLGGRLPVPLLLILDEAGNICKIGDLPAQYSHLGGRGIIAVCILQNYAQGVGVWGEVGMTALWSAATVKLIGAGTDDEKFGEKVSKLIGDHDVTVASLSRGARGEVTESVSVRQQRILSAAQIRELAPFTSLVLATGCRVAAIDMLPWTTSNRAAQVGKAMSEATVELQRRAQAADV